MRKPRERMALHADPFPRNCVIRKSPSLMGQSEAEQRVKNNPTILPRAWCWPPPKLAASRPHLARCA
jgi:hypothetical protein